LRPLVAVLGALPMVTGTAGTLVAGTAATAPAAAASVARYVASGPADAPPRTPALSGVAAASGRNAWAVGGHVILHWNGHAWSRVPSPLRGVRSFLLGVAVSAAGNAWAVGATSAGQP